MVAVVVGSVNTRFELFKDHLCDASPYFRQALTRGMKETDAQSISLPHVDVDMFESFCYWLNTCKIPKFERPTLWLSMIRLWLFADAHEVHGLMNDIIDAIIAAACGRKPPQFNSLMLHTIYDNTAPSSSLRKLFVDLAIHLPELRWLRYDLDGEYPDEYLDDVAKAQIGLIRGSNWVNPIGRTKLQLVSAQVAATYMVDLRTDFPTYKAQYHVTFTHRDQTQEGS